ncbi:MAG: hypothetical protein ACTSXY_02565 [Promethearchaeota archaeon]
MLPLQDLPLEEKKHLSGINKAFALNIPIRMGIRFEDFLRNERRAGISLKMMRYLAEIEYPLMINTKSNILRHHDYVQALAANKAGTAVHMTMITSNPNITKRLEPGAPSFLQRLSAAKCLSDAGVRVVARIEPYLFLLTDRPEDLAYYMEKVWEAGVRNITYDTYSYTALNQGIRQSFINAGYDFDRMYLAGCDSQPFGSLLLSKFMDLFREYGFSCSTFDMGNVPSNDQDICCEVGDLFKGGFNYGCTVIAARFIVSRKGEKTSWENFSDYVEMNGGFLTENLKYEVKQLWNLEGNVAYSNRWATGLIPCGRDGNGLIWKWEKDQPDYREELLRRII